MATREQQRAQLAYARVAERAEQDKEADYKRFSKRFPALIQTCGLAQALAFAEAKEQTQYLQDLACVAGACNAETLTRQAREAELPVYQKLSRDTLAAAAWLKRYAEALLQGDEE
ncbi:MAG: type III-B CRISPR module-associated protein Cmr5 [Gammaproteobacteria bacterium]